VESANQLEAWNTDSLETATDTVQSIFGEGVIDVDPPRTRTGVNSRIVIGDFDICQTSQGEENAAIDIVGARKLHGLSEVFFDQQP